MIGVTVNIVRRQPHPTWNFPATGKHFGFSLDVRDQPCFCLCFGSGQITMTLPLRLMTLHFSHIGLTDGRTFMVVTSLSLRTCISTL